MFDLNGDPIERGLQREAEILGEYPVIGRYQHPYNGHGHVLLACGHQLRVEGEVAGISFMHCGRCPAPCAKARGPLLKKEGPSAPRRKVVRTEQMPMSKKLKGWLECSHFIVGFKSVIRLGRVTRCEECLKEGGAGE